MIISQQKMLKEVKKDYKNSKKYIFDEKDILNPTL